MRSLLILKFESAHQASHIQYFASNLYLIATNSTHTPETLIAK